MEAIFSVPKAAKLIGLSERTVRELVYTNKIPFYRIGVRILFRESELEKWLEYHHHEVKSPGEPVDFLHANKLSVPETQTH
jgi:excisionase family DNA binding protein